MNSMPGHKPAVDGDPSSCKYDTQGGGKGGQHQHHWMKRCVRGSVSDVVDYSMRGCVHRVYDRM